MGCRSASRRCVSSASANTRSRMRLRFMAPDASTNALPNWRMISATAAPPAAVSSCEMASVSTTVAPSRANSSAAALLPLPMPPVRPTTRPNENTSPGQVPAHDGLAPEHRHDRGDCEVGTEMKAKRAVPAASRRHHLQHAKGEADHRGEQDHQRQHLPTEECADCRAHLEVAEAHAFLAG